MANDKTMMNGAGETMIYSADRMAEARAQLKERWTAIPEDAVGQPTVPVVEVVILARTVYERGVEELSGFEAVFRAFGSAQIDANL